MIFPIIQTLTFALCAVTTAVSQTTSTTESTTPTFATNPGPINPVPPSFSPTATTSAYPSPTLGKNASSLQVTAIIGRNNVSAFQCWKIQPDFIISQQLGTVGARIQLIGDITG